MLSDFLKFEDNQKQWCLRAYCCFWLFSKWESIKLFLLQSLSRVFDSFLSYLVFLILSSVQNSNVNKPQIITSFYIENEINLIMHTAKFETFSFDQIGEPSSLAFLVWLYFFKKNRMCSNSSIHWRLFTLTH